MRKLSPHSRFSLFRRYLERHRDEVRTPDLELAAFVCVTAIESLTHNAVLHHRLNADKATASLVGEATRLALAYLAR